MSEVPPPPPPPPSYGPPPSSPAWGDTPAFERIGGVARALVVLLVIIAVSSALSGVFAATSRSDAQDFIAGRISRDDFFAAVAPFAAMSVVTGAVTIALAVLTMIWMFRVARNQRALGRPGRWSPGWAIGGWFLPPVLFVIPLLMLRELWKGSDPSVPRSGDAWRSAPDGPIVWVWWVLYGLIPTLLIPVGVGSSLDLSTTSDELALAEQLDERFAMNLVSSLASAAAAVAFLVLVRQLTARQQELTGGR